jgi:hypothetical protein
MIVGEIVTYFFRTQQLRRFAKMAGKQGDVQNVRSLGVWRHMGSLCRRLPGDVSAR